MNLEAVLARGNFRPPTVADIDAEISRRRPVWKPQPGPQTMAYLSPADILGYGGSAGGGKSDLGIGLALTAHRNSAIFRREKDDGHDLFDRAVEAVTGTKARTNENLKAIRDIPGDRKVRFLGVKNPGDEQKHRGRARDLYVFDEATEFDEDVIRFLIAWNRTTIPNQRCRVVLTFNPPRRKHGQWLKKFFAPWLDRAHPDYPAPPGKLYWYTTIKGVDVQCDNGDPIEIEVDGRKETVKPVSRTFIPATLDDNAFLRDTNYRAMLQALPEPLRSQLLYGDMQAEDDDDVFQVIPTKWILAAFDRWTQQTRPDRPLDAVGSDISRGGKDRTTNVARIAHWFDFPQSLPGKETHDGPAALRFLAKFLGGYRCDPERTLVGMDVIGVGSSPLDIARQMKVQVVAMDAAGGSERKDRSGMLSFVNKRAEWWWTLREALDPAQGLDLALPPDNELLVDLTAPHFDVTVRGIVIESKDSIRKRLKRSTDKGDAVLHAFAVKPQAINYRGAEPRQEFDEWGAEATTLFGDDGGQFF